jgi:hypothetical protein
MRRLSLWFSVATLALTAIGIVAGLVAMTQHVPAFYLRANMAAGPQRQELSNHFITKAANLWESVKNDSGGNADWFCALNEAEINAFFAEGFLRDPEPQKLLPEGASEPRVEIEKDRMRLGFRYGNSLWSTIISIDFRVWLAKGQPNALVLELQGLHAGSLPVSAQSLLEDISTSLSRHNIQVSWYRHQGNPTAALKFQSDQPRPGAILQHVDLQPGILNILGHSSQSFSDGG